MEELKLNKELFTLHSVSCEYSPLTLQKGIYNLIKSKIIYTDSSIRLTLEGFEGYLMADLFEYENAIL